MDYDNDGGLDLSITDGYTDVGGHFLFRNTIPDEAKRRSLSVLVLDAKGHQTRFGAEVRLFDASGRIIAARQVVTGGGYNTQRAAPVHFGSTSLAPVTVEVTFMSKKGRVKQTLKNVSPEAYRGKSLVVREGAFILKWDGASGCDRAAPYMANSSAGAGSRARRCRRGAP